MLSLYNFDDNVVAENKHQAVNFLKNKYKHLNNLEIKKCISDEDVNFINDKLKGMENNEIHYATDLGNWKFGHTTTFIYGKIDNKPFIMYFDYPDENQSIGFSKIKDNKEVTKVILPRIQNDTNTCFMFQTKMLQTMTPEVIRNLVKQGEKKKTKHTYKTDWIRTKENPEGACYTFEYPAAHIEIKQLPKELLTYMQSLTEIKKLDNGKEIFDINKKRGFIRKEIGCDLEIKDRNVKAKDKICQLYGNNNVDGRFFDDLYSVKNEKTVYKKNQEEGCTCNIF